VGADNEVFVFQLGIRAFDHAQDVDAPDQRGLGCGDHGDLGTGDVHRGGLVGRLDLGLQIVDRFTGGVEQEIGHLAGEAQGRRVSLAHGRLGVAGDGHPHAGLVDDRPLVVDPAGSREVLVDVEILAVALDLDDGAGPSLAISAALLKRAGPPPRGPIIMAPPAGKYLSLSSFLRLKAIWIVTAGRFAEHQDDLALEVRPLSSSHWIEGSWMPYPTKTTGALIVPSAPPKPA